MSVPPRGARPKCGGTSFRVWAPDHDAVDLIVLDGRAQGTHALQPGGAGHFSAFVPGVSAGDRYLHRLGTTGDFPDPASRSQPEGVHGPSAVVDPSFAWTDSGWRGRPLEELVIYELHVGTFTAGGTFDAAIGRLDDLAELGITAIEIMPVAEFPGSRNWGYDGASLWAPSRNYGGPAGLRRLVDRAHALGLAVILDLVHNHLGPEGNYLWAHGRRHFTERHRTPWGDGVNLDGEDSRPVRDFLIGNALHWLEEYHLDGLRLDATHELRDDSQPHYLLELANAVRRLEEREGRKLMLIAEDERNDPRLCLPAAQGGLGLDAVWADDLHHALRRALAGDDEGYYASYTGSTAEVARTLERGWLLEGQAHPGRGAPRGADPTVLPYPAFVRCIQNHDQVGNRALGTRLNHDIGLAAYRVASTLLLLDPATPLVFMGQEWAASAPFLFFTDLGPELGAAVTEGRRKEFAGFRAFADERSRDHIPDPQAPSTFERSRLDWGEAAREPHAGVRRLYRDLLTLRREHPALLERSRASVRAAGLGKDALVVRREGPGPTALLLVLNIRGRLDAELSGLSLAGDAVWEVRLSSEHASYGGAGRARLDSGRLRSDGPAAILLEKNSG